MFEYNHDLIFEDNMELMGKLKTIPEEEIKNTILEVAQKEITTDGLIDEFITTFKGFKRIKKITGDNIRCFFAITLNGTSKIWNTILNKYSDIFNKKSYPLYENILEYIDEMLDEINFDEIYKKEINELNAIA